MGTGERESINKQQLSSKGSFVIVIKNDRDQSTEDRNERKCHEEEDSCADGFMSTRRGGGQVSRGSRSKIVDIAPVGYLVAGSMRRVETVKFRCQMKQIWKCQFLGGWANEAMSCLLR